MHDCRTGGHRIDTGACTHAAPVSDGPETRNVFFIYNKKYNLPTWTNVLPEDLDPLVAIGALVFVFDADDVHELVHDDAYSAEALPAECDALSSAAHAD